MSEAKRESKGPVRGYFFDKSVVVTGASSGIGHDVALAFGEQGAQVALLARRRVQLEELAHENQQGRRQGARARLRRDRSRARVLGDRAGQGGLRQSRHPDQLGGPADRGDGRDHAPRRSRKNDGGERLRRAQRDAGGAARDAQGQVGQHREYLVAGGTPRRQPARRLQLDQVCAGRDDGSAARRAVQHRNKSVARDARGDRHSDGAQCAQARLAQGRLRDDGDAGAMGDVGGAGRGRVRADRSGRSSRRRSRGKTRVAVPRRHRRAA